jgi:leukotriene-A4 hydrolase
LASEKWAIADLLSHFTQWLHGSGDDLPVDMKYDETLAEQVISCLFQAFRWRMMADELLHPSVFALQCYELANRWKAASEKDDYSEFSPKDMQELTATQRSKSISQGECI